MNAYVESYDGTMCGKCDGFTHTDRDGNCEECGESKL